MTTELRIDPLQGGTETSLRFWFLAVMTLTASTYAWQYLHFRYVDPAPVGLLECTQNPSGRPAPPYSSNVAQCWAENISHPTALTLLISSLTVIALTLAAVPLLAVGYMRRRGIHTLPYVHREIGERVAQLSQEVGVRGPQVVVEPDSSASARMLSGGRRPLLILRLGMLQAYRSELGSFDAVVAHELGHVRNRDVVRAQVAIAAWWTLAICAVLPYAVGSFTMWSDENTAPLLKFFALLAVAHWLRNATLRAREYEADVVAGRGGEHRTALRALLRRAVTGNQSRRRRILSTHPPAARRLESLESPGLLLRASVFDVACVGGLAFFSAPAIQFVWAQVFYGRSAMTYAPTVAAATIGILAGVGLWRVAWRDALAQRYIRRRPLQPLRASFALLAGALAGGILVPVPSTDANANHYGFVLSHSLTGVAVALVLGIIAATIAVAIAFGLARLAVARSRNLTSMVLLRTVVSFSVAGLCAVVFHWVQVAVSVLTTSQDLVAEALLFSTAVTLSDTWVQVVLVFSSIVVAVVLPLRRGTVRDRPTWLFISTQRSPNLR